MTDPSYNFKEINYKKLDLEDIRFNEYIDEDPWGYKRYDENLWSKRRESLYEFPPERIEYKINEFIKEPLPEKVTFNSYIFKEPIKIDFDKYIKKFEFAIIGYLSNFKSQYKPVSKNDARLSLVNEEAVIDSLFDNQFTENQRRVYVEGKNISERRALASNVGTVGDLAEKILQAFVQGVEYKASGNLVPNFARVDSINVLLERQIEVRKSEVYWSSFSSELFGFRLPSQVIESLLVDFDDNFLRNIFYEFKSNYIFESGLKPIGEETSSELYGRFLTRVIDFSSQRLKSVLNLMYNPKSGIKDPQEIKDGLQIVARLRFFRRYMSMVRANLGNSQEAISEIDGGVYVLGMQELFKHCANPLPIESVGQKAIQYNNNGYSQLLGGASRDQDLHSIVDFDEEGGQNQPQIILATASKLLSDEVVLARAKTTVGYVDKDKSREVLLVDSVLADISMYIMHPEWQDHLLYQIARYAESRGIAKILVNTSNGPNQYSLVDSTIEFALKNGYDVRFSSSMAEMQEKIKWISDKHVYFEKKDASSWSKQYGTMLSTPEGGEENSLSYCYNEAWHNYPQMELKIGEQILEDGSVRMIYAPIGKEGYINAIEIDVQKLLKAHRLSDMISSFTINYQNLSETSIAQKSL